jgi:hypothetical protein
VDSKGTFQYSALIWFIVSIFKLVFIVFFCFLKGLITRDRQKLEPHKVEFARQDIDSKTTIRMSLSLSLSLSLSFNNTRTLFSICTLIMRADWFVLLRSVPTLFDVVRYVKPTALIGLSGQGGAFTREVWYSILLFCNHWTLFSLASMFRFFEKWPNTLNDRLFFHFRIPQRIRNVMHKQFVPHTFCFVSDPRRRIIHL